jgi:hypothetical protein
MLLWGVSTETEGIKECFHPRELGDVRDTMLEIHFYYITSVVTWLRETLSISFLYQCELKFSQKILWH